MVVGIEHIPALTALAEKNIRSDGLGRAIDSDGERRIVLVTGDGRLGAFSRVVTFFIFIFLLLLLRV